jgi:ubiquinone/menaquinone biosynthesis C-methylase UbiE
MFELGARYYAKKLAAGPEAELRREFAGWVGCHPSARVLDVGCGPGHLALLLARGGCQVTGVDRGRRLLVLARDQAARGGLQVSFARASADMLPFPDVTFDCTLATTVIYFVARPERCLQEMTRVTRSGGVVATLDPHASMSVAAMRAYCRQEALPSADARKLLAWAGAAQWNRRFDEPSLRGLLEGAGLANLHLERRLGGMVWFARGINLRS